MLFFFFFNDTATTEIYTLSLHDALPISVVLPGDPSAYCHCGQRTPPSRSPNPRDVQPERSEEHTSELQSRLHLVCRLLLEKKKIKCIFAMLESASTVLITYGHWLAAPYD